MAIPTPDHLFEQAEGLLSLYPGRKPRQTELRRAISSSYYGIFHFVLAQAADTHIGAKYRASPRYVLAYRSISHTWLRALCAEIIKPTVSAALKPFLPAGGFGADMRGFARVTSDLQERRHAADYDPATMFVRGDAESAISAARVAVGLFHACPLKERQLFLTLLLFPPRGRA